MDLVIYGAGGLAREVAFLAREINAASGTPPYRLLGYVEDDCAGPVKTIGDLPVLGDGSWFDKRREQVGCVVGIGTPRALATVSRLLRTLDNVSFPNLVHPGVIWDAARIEIGEGNVITAGSIFTTDIRIGSFNIFNLSCTYGHDVVIGDCCVINPGCSISGNVTLEGENLIGTRAGILQTLTIGRGATVGSGALVTKDVAPGDVVVGIPAKPLARK
ncbi:acetyltransferase [bacterium]|nr:acetyltransferase [bacterium]MBU1071694.1 acetyltransferase [bacterium]MBU1676661.1 acetyltransferase [bacterium]